MLFHPQTSSHLLSLFFVTHLDVALLLYISFSTNFYFAIIFVMKNLHSLYSLWAITDGNDVLEMITIMKVVNIGQAVLLTVNIVQLTCPLSTWSNCQHSVSQIFVNFPQTRPKSWQSDIHLGCYFTYYILGTKIQPNNMHSMTQIRMILTESQIVQIDISQGKK